MRKQRATYEDVDRAAADGDVVTVDFKGTQDGTPFDGGTATDFPFALGQGRMLPEFEAAVAGMKPGESRTFPLTFPADYTAKELAGKTVQFEVTLKKVQQPVLPPIDAQFAKSLGIADGDLEQDARRDQHQPRARGDVAAARAQQGQRDGGPADGGVVRSAEVARRRRERSASPRRRATTWWRAECRRQDAPLPLELFQPQAERRVRLGPAPGRSRAHERTAAAARPDPQAGRGDGAELRAPAGSDQLVPVRSQAPGRARSRSPSRTM